MDFRERAKKIALWVDYAVPGRRQETYRDIENALHAAYSQGVEDAKEIVKNKTLESFQQNEPCELWLAKQIEALKPLSEKI